VSRLYGRYEQIISLGAVADWTTISSLATAGGTLVLAVATFSSVRSANLATRIAQEALLINTRPVLFSSRMDDPQQKVRWGDDHHALLRGSGAVLEQSDEDGTVYLAASLRNVGQGIAVIQGWRIEPDPSMREMVRPDADTFRPQSRDLYVPSGDVGFWQGALRIREDPDCPEASAAIRDRRGLMIDLLYADHQGGQRTISRFIFLPRGDEGWYSSVIRHWNLDRPDPR
jgi:hypothetical protein